MVCGNPAHHLDSGGFGGCWYSTGGSFQSDINQKATCELWRPEMSHMSDSDWFNTVALEQSWTSELDVGSVRSRKALCLISAAWCSAAAALCKYRGQSHSPPRLSAPSDCSSILALVWWMGGLPPPSKLQPSVPNWPTPPWVSNGHLENTCGGGGVQIHNPVRCDTEAVSFLLTVLLLALQLEMRSSLVSLLTCVGLLSAVCGASPLFNLSMDGSGDETEPELLFPTSFSTRLPAHLITAATGAPDSPNSITTTMIRLKDYVLSRVVDFLQENLLIIIVVTSLLIVMVFIICCASAMSHKRKLEAYKPPPKPAKKHAAEKTSTRKDSSELQERPYVVDHIKRVQTQSSISPRMLRTPSKALVGERGRDVRSSPRPEVRKAREAEEVEKRREEPRQEVQQGSSSSSSSPVCTCYLKKTHHWRVRRSTVTADGCQCGINVL